MPYIRFALRCFLPLPVIQTWGGPDVVAQMEALPNMGGPDGGADVGGPDGGAPDVGGPFVWVNEPLSIADV